MTRRTAAALLAATVGLTAACSSNDADPAPTSSSSTPAGSSSAAADPDWLDPQIHVDPILAKVDKTDPVDVGRAIAEIACTWSPVVDLTETAALIRAKPLLTTDYAATLAEPQRGASTGIFVQAATAKAVSVPSVKQRTDIADAPPATDTTQYLAYAVTWTWTTADKKPAAVDDPRLRTVYVVAQKQADGTWLASSVDSQDQQLATTSASPSK